MESQETARLAETTLIDRASSGDVQAWEEVVRHYEQVVFRFAYLILGEVQAAEDVAQEVFMRGYYGLKRFDQTRPIRPWLMSITANLARNRLRSFNRYLAALQRYFLNAPEPESPSAEHESLEQIQSQTLWQTVRALSQPYQQVIYLRYFLEMPVEEVAQALAIPTGTVKSRLHRGLKMLQSALVAEDQQ